MPFPPEPQEKLKQIASLYTKPPAVPASTPAVVKESSPSAVEEEPAVEPGLKMPTAPPEINPVSAANGNYVPLPEDQTANRSKIFAPPAGVTTRPVPLVDGAIPSFEGGKESTAPPADQTWTPADGKFVTVGRRTGAQREVSRLQQENAELKGFVLQRGRQAQIQNHQTSLSVHALYDSVVQI